MNVTQFLQTGLGRRDIVTKTPLIDVCTCCLPVLERYPFELCATFSVLIFRDFSEKLAVSLVVSALEFSGQEPEGCGVIFLSDFVNGFQPTCDDYG